MGLQREPLVQLVAAYQLATMTKHNPDHSTDSDVVTRISDKLTPQKHDFAVR
jgi:hypothetical protein